MVAKSIRSLKNCFENVNISEYSPYKNVVIVLVMSSIPFVQTIVPPSS